MTERQRSSALESVESVQTGPETLEHTQLNRRRFLGFLAATGILTVTVGCGSKEESEDEKNSLDVIVFYDRTVCERTAEDLGETVVEFTDPNGKTIYLLSDDAERLRAFVEEANRQPAFEEQKLYASQKECEEQTGGACAAVHGKEGVMGYAPVKKEGETDEKKKEEKPVEVRQGSSVHYFPYHIYHPIYQPYYGASAGSFDRATPMHVSASRTSSATGVRSSSPVSVKPAPGGRTSGAFSGRSSGKGSSGGGFKGGGFRGGAGS